MSATLASVAMSLETAAGASTSANTNEAGYWKRIAASAESLAGTSSVANDNIAGYQLRTAIALESIAGTSGAEENANESGYLKRIVDALEVQSGAVETGSLLHRLLLGAENAEFSEELPVIQNGTFTGSDNWTDTNGGGTATLTLTGTGLAFVGGTGTTVNYVEQTVAGLSAGDVVTLQYELTASSEMNTPIFSIGGGASANGNSAVGIHTVDVTVGESGTNLRIRGTGTSSTTWTMDNISITNVS